MTDQDMIGAAQFWLEAKAQLARANDFFVQFRPRREVAQMDSPYDVGLKYIHAGSPYAPDGPYGVADHYAHPERVELFIMDANARRGVCVDCDDIAMWARASLARQRGAGNITDDAVVALLDRNISAENKTHVIYAGRFRGKAFAVDTNGYRPLPDLLPATLIREWKKIYPDADYFAVIPCPIPEGW